MKLQYQLQGTFHRIQLSGTDSIPVSLVDLIREVQVVATESRFSSPAVAAQRTRHYTNASTIQLLRQSFGLNFLPEKVLINLLQQQG